MQGSSRALIVEDDQSSRTVISRVCSSLDMDVHEAERGDEGLRLIEGNDYNLLLSDYMMPGIDGIELVEKARILRPEIPIILVTGYATIDRTVRAMTAGADHVLEKPIEPPALRDVVQAIIARKTKFSDKIEQAHIKRPNPLGARFISLFQGRMQHLAQLMERVSETTCTVLIRGESGTGKELVARAIHERSRRSSGPFVPVNCGAIPETLLESELFGYQRGAFSGAFRDRPGRFTLADGGTIFLDEIGEMSPSFQVKLLRVLQEHCFEPVGGVKPVTSDFRVIAATHRNLQEMVEEGKFREDLFYRLNVMEITIPPLRERTEDVSLLLDHFVDKYNKRYQLEVKTGDERLLASLQQYQWHGNVREMENLIERMCIIKNKGLLEAGDLPPHIFCSPVTSTEGESLSLPDEGTNFYKAVENFENTLITQALQRSNGNKNRAASMLSLNRTTLVEKMKKKGMI
jgi:DNA-binding NtrC family response regulator